MLITKQFGKLNYLLNTKQCNALIITKKLLSSDAPADKTSLYNFHVKNRGKLVNFAGYLLPVQYADLGIAASHVHTRTHASIFDVSHMLQTHVRGSKCVEWFESICTADIAGLSEGSGSLTVFTNKNGGILDDLIVTKVTPEHLYVVSNAGRKDHDKNHMLQSLKSFKDGNHDVKIIFQEPSERALLALQGPEAITALQPLTDVSLESLYFMTSTSGSVAGIADCRITRCGYTGEDGVEISIPADKATDVANALLESKVANVKLAGLGARDSLRLEAGMCLYGNDIDETTSPVEAGLAWLIAKRRRQEANFPGADIIQKQLGGACIRRRVGIRQEAGPPARHGAQIFSPDHKTLLGEVTSGCPSPSLGGNVAMGYVAENYKKIGTELALKVRDKFVKAVIAKMPFTPAHYYNKPKQ